MAVQYIRDTQLAERFDVSRATIWRWASEGKLPPPVRLGAGVTRWRLDEIEAFERAREREGRVPA